jgi:hypothetical protein
MANYNVSVTQSIEAQPANIAAGESTTYVISNPLPATSYFTLETARNTNGFYDSTSPKNTSGSFTLGTGITSLIQSDYIAGVIVQPGGGNLTFVPAVNITNSTLYLRGVGSNEGVAFPPVPPIPLLDIYPSSVAYSLRKLRTAYTGSAVRVRRSSDNTEQDIGFNSLAELDTTALLAFVGAGNGFVTTWYDQSLNGYNAIQTTAANQPQIVSSGSLILDNGKTSLQFNGNRGLRNTNLVYTTNTLFATSVFSKDNNASFTVLLSQNSDGVGRSSVLAFNNTSPAKSLYFFNNGTSYNNESLNTFPNSTQTLMTNYSFGNDYFNAINGGGGNNVISGQSFTPVSVNGTGIGQSPNQTQRHLGKIQEIILWNSDQSANKTAIETNINNYYGIY